MPVFYTKLKRWGNSLGLTIPKEIVEREKLTTEKPVRILVSQDREQEFRKLVGSMTFDRNTDEIMREIDEGYDEVPR